MKTKEKNLADPAESAYKAKEETENYLNRWINDSTKGWPLRSHLVKDNNNNFSIPFAMWVYPFLIGPRL